MPPQKTKSLLVQKLGDKARKAFQAHKADETPVDQGGDLPSGLSGIAQLIDVRFGLVKEGKANAGQPFFMARATVLSPKTFTDELGNLHFVEGKQTSIMEMCCDTPQSKGRQTVEDHLAQVALYCRRLGLDTSNMDDVEDLEAALPDLKEAAPTFQFRTFKMPKETVGKYAGQEPRVNHVWGALVDESALEAVGVHLNGVNTSQTQDSTAAPAAKEEGSARPVNRIAAKPSAPPTAPAPKAPPPRSGPKKSAPPPEPEPEPEPEPPQESEEPDLEALAAAADNGDEDAQTALWEMAESVGLNPSEMEIENYAGLAVAIQEAGAEAGGDEPAGEAEPGWPPAVGLCFKYVPSRLDPRTKKTVKAKAAVECEVTAVDEEEETVSVKNLEDGGKTLYKGVKWADLIR